MTLSKAIRQATTITYDYPDPDKIHGFDISHWAGSAVDFSKAAETGAKFVFIKATNGINEVAWFRENWAGSKGHLARGAYHWLYPSHVTSANGQARKLFDLLTEMGDFGELPVVVDFEKTWHNYQIANPTPSDLWGFVATWESLTGVKPIIYTGPSFWSTNGSKDPLWAEYRLWIANYKTLAPAVPLPWSDYTFWQWTESGFGENYGVNKLFKRAVDLNYFNGNDEELAALFLDDNDNGGDMTTYIYSATSSVAMSLRSGHSTSDTRLATLAIGQKAEGDVVWIAPEDGDQVHKNDIWLNVKRIGTQQVDYWVAIVHLGKKYCNITPDVIIDPPGPAEKPSSIVLKYGDGTSDEYFLGN